MENILKRSKSHIYSALLKYGHSNFSLTILEYCDNLLAGGKKNVLKERIFICPQKIMSTISLKNAGAPFTGRKHSDESKTIMFDASLFSF